ncbi:MAG TPA: acyl-ACP--UDP-N-acetylglucosamine O-acyltransferase [bacterium]
MAQPGGMRTATDPEGAGVHPTAIVDPQAELGPNVTIGPYAVVKGPVRIGEGTRVGAHGVIEGRTTIGRDCEIFSGAVIGSIPQDLKYRGEASELIIGDRNKFREYVTVNPGTEGGGGRTVIGSDCLLMAYAHVAHDCRLGDQVILANSVALAGHITIGDRAVVGGLVGVHQFVRIGTLAMVGGCSRVTQDVPPYSTCVGYPARIYGLNSEGLKRADVAAEAKERLHRAFRMLFYSRMSLRHAIEETARLIEPCEELTLLLAFLRQSKRGICRAGSVAE